MKILIDNPEKQFGCSLQYLQFLVDNPDSLDKEIREGRAILAKFIEDNPHLINEIKALMRDVKRGA